MKAILKTYWNIILLRGHAYELPYRIGLPFFWIGLDIGMVFLLSMVLDNPLWRDLAIELSDLGYTAAALYFALWYYNKRPRFLQSYSAMLGVGSLFLIALSAMVLVVQIGSVIGVFSQIIYFWILVVFTHVLKDALEVTFLKAALWILGFEMGRFLVITQLLQRLT